MRNHHKWLFVPIAVFIISIAMAIDIGEGMHSTHPSIKEVNKQTLLQHEGIIDQAPCEYAEKDKQIQPSVSQSTLNQ